MKRFYAVFASTLLFTGLANANEPVNPANKAPSHTARHWQKDNDLIIGHIRGNRLAAMKNTSANIVAFLHESVLTDASLNWHGEYFPAVNGGPQVHFGVRCIFNNEDNTTSDNDLTVFANDLSPLIAHLTVNGTDYTTLKGFTGAQGGSRFEFDVENGLHVKAWLIASDSTTLPYIPVSRKEYLDQARTELEALKEVVVADTRGKIHVRSAEEQEAEKQAMLQQLKETYSGIELQARIRVYLHNYLKDEDLITQTIARNVAGYNCTIRLIDSIQHNSTPAQLAQPAVVSVNAADFNGFEDGQDNASLLVRMNPAYFTGNDDAPRCLLVCFRYNPAQSQAAGIDRQLAENFNRGSLQALLAR